MSQYKFSSSSDGHQGDMPYYRNRNGQDYLDCLLSVYGPWILQHMKQQSSDTQSSWGLFQY